MSEHVQIHINRLEFSRNVRTRDTVKNIKELNVPSEKKIRKFCQHTLETIPKISLFDSEKKSWRNDRSGKLVFRNFCKVFEELEQNGPQNQMERQILL